MKTFQKLPKLSPGDQVGIISLSAGLPGIFPWVQDLGLARMRKLEQNDGFFWDSGNNVEGILWGDCVESIVAQLAAAKYLPSDNDIDGTILALETAEDIPEHWIIEYILTGLGERGWLDKFQAVLVGRPKAWEFNKQMTPEQKAKYRQAQRKTVIDTVRQYNTEIPIVQNLDFGHTDPQVVLPLGQKAKIAASQHKVYLKY